MDDGSALLAAIVDRPDDDTPRLVFADWLDDMGDVNRAAFIRNQVKMACLPQGSEAYRELDTATRAQFEELIPEGILPKYSAFTGSRLHNTIGDGFVFTRGFLEQIMIDPEKAASLTPAIEALPLPLRSIRLKSYSGSYVDEYLVANNLVTQPWFKAIKHLQLEDTYDTRLWRDLLHNPEISHVETIDFLCGNFRDNTHPQANPGGVVWSPCLSNVRHLNFRHYDFLNHTLAPNPEIEQQHVRAFFNELRLHMHMNCGSLINLEDVNGTRLPADIRRAQAELRRHLAASVAERAH